MIFKITLIIIAMSMYSIAATAGDLDDGISKYKDDSIQKYDDLGSNEINIKRIIVKAKSDAHRTSGENATNSQGGGGDTLVGSVKVGAGSRTGDIIVINNIKDTSVVSGAK